MMNPEIKTKEAEKKEVAERKVCLDRKCDEASAEMLVKKGKQSTH